MSNNALTPVVWRYDRLLLGFWLPSPIWVAGRPTIGIVLQAPDEKVAATTVENYKVRWKQYMIGDPFFVAAGPLPDGIQREMFGLDAAPPDIAAAWMKMKLQGRLTDA